MSFLKSEEHLFRKARLKWNLLFTLTIISLFFAASTTVFFILSNMDASRFENELVRLSAEIEKRIMNLPALIREKLLSVGENRPLLYLSENEILQIYDLNGKKVYDNGIDFPETTHFKEGFSEQNEFRFFTRSVKNLRGLPIMFLRVGRNVNQISENRNSFLRTLVYLFLLTFTGSWILGNILSKYVLKPLKLSYEQLKRFTSDASHELKTPLTVMRTSVDLIPKEGLPPSVQQKLAYIDQSVQKMHHLVDQLILLAKSEMPRGGKLRKERVDIDALWESILYSKAPIIQKKRITVETNVERAAGDHSRAVETHSHLICHTSRECLQVILNNLVDNALKFTPDEGKITLSTLKRGKEWVFVVADTGEGIPESEIEKIFERFYKVENSRNQAEGSGMGLAIAKEYAHLMQAKIQVSSRLGEGSRFELRFLEK